MRVIRGEETFKVVLVQSVVKKMKEKFSKIVKILSCNILFSGIEHNARI